MSAATLFDDQAGNDASTKIAPMLERVDDKAVLQRLSKLNLALIAMERQGYQIGIPAKVRQPTKHTYAEWHIPIARNDCRCVLSFFINEVFNPNEQRQRHR